MEKRLQDFINSVTQLADVRNLDMYNPVHFQMESPTTALRYTIVASKIEPSYMGVPINVTWIVLDPTDPYYMKALKLRDVYDAETAAAKPQPSGIDAWWHVVRTYEEIFRDPQYYVNATGPAGPVGPTGPAGADGPPGTVDLDELALRAIDRMAQLAGTLRIDGPAIVPAAGQALFEVYLTEPDRNPDGTLHYDEAGELVWVESKVLAPIIIQQVSAALPANTVMLADGTLKAGTTSVDVPVKLYAAYPSWTKMVSTEHDVTITSKTVTGIAINGANSLYAGATSNYTVTATYSDGSTGTISPNSWVVDNTQHATISGAGLLTAAGQVDSNKQVQLTATYNGMTATKNVSVLQVVATALTVSGPATLQGGASGTYTARATLNNGTQINVTPTWTTNQPELAPISSGGVMTTLNETFNVTVSASYVHPGSTAQVSGTRAVAVTKVETPIYPYYGTGPALPSDWQTFIPSLQYRGTEGNLNVSMEIDAVGKQTYMYFAAPKSYGYARFLDVLSSFYGGWGGAGNSGPGPSAASVAASDDMPVEVTINVDGTPVVFYVYRTDYANMGEANINKWQVSAQP